MWKIYRVVLCLSAYSVPENTNQRESAEFAGVIRASFMGALFEGTEYAEKTQNNTICINKKAVESVISAFYVKIQTISLLFLIML